MKPQLQTFSPNKIITTKGLDLAFDEPYGSSLFIQLVCLILFCYRSRPTIASLVLGEWV